MTTAGNKNGLGAWACTALIVGNMVGAGFYLSPAALAPYGNLAILAWIVMGAGAICLGLTFAKLARMAPAAGGPYAYTRMAYGEFPGFLIAWGYWISIWVSLPVIAVAFAGAVANQFPALHNRPMVLALTLGSMWLVVLVNLRGVKAAGNFAKVAMLGQIVPFAVIAILGLIFVHPAHFSEFNPSGKPLLTASLTIAPLTMFAFLGLESATVPAGDVRDPKRTIARATVLGIGIAAMLYVLGTIVVFGVVPREQLVKSVAPLSDAARIMWGPWGAAIISTGIMVSCLSALNGWTLMMGQIPMAASRDGLFPSVFGKVSSRGVPVFSVLLSAGLATALLLFQVSGSAKGAEIYHLLIGMSTMTAVIPYAFCSLAAGLVAAREAVGGKVPRVTIVEGVAFLFAIFTLYGCGPEAVLHGLLLLLLGIPVYVWQRRRAVHALM